MLAMWMKVRVNAEERERFPKAIEVDALGSERDEPGCLRFNVLRDRQDPNFLFLPRGLPKRSSPKARRTAPYYAVWRAAADILDVPTQAARCDSVSPAAVEYWEKCRSSW